MKQGIHPDYREVVFQDEDAGFAFLTRSTIKTSETISWEDGNDYPVSYTHLTLPTNREV